jgi:hypothetical protein
MWTPSMSRQRRRQPCKTRWSVEKARFGCGKTMWEGRDKIMTAAFEQLPLSYATGSDPNNATPRITAARLPRQGRQAVPHDRRPLRCGGLVALQTPSHRDSANGDVGDATRHLPRSRAVAGGRERGLACGGSNGPQRPVPPQIGSSYPCVQGPGLAFHLVDPRAYDRRYPRGRNESGCG